MAQLTGYDYFLENALTYGWMLPRGVILMWSGTIANIPTGYVLCNGTSGTPNLVDRFIVGANQDDGGVAKTNITGSLTYVGGSYGHIHGFYGDGHDHAMTSYLYASGSGSYYSWDQQYSSDMGYSTGYTHTTETLPPYYALALIMKT